MKEKSGVFSRVIRKSAMAAGLFFSAKAVINSINKFRIRNKVVLITGGTRGLGIVLARKLAERGARIVICGRSADNLEEASEELSSITNTFLPIQCDITDRQQVKEMVERIKNELGDVDLLVNNAGIIQVGPVETMNEGDFENAMNTHFWGPFYAMREVIPGMMKKNTGRIINIVSIGGKVSFPHLLPYNASKYALSGLSEGMTAELKKQNIKITTVYPGLMRTGSPRNIDLKGQQEKEYAWFKIFDSLPLISTNAERAADKIIKAMQKGQKTLTLTIPAKLAVAAHGIAPGVTISIFDFIDTLLPKNNGNEEIKKGYESETAVSQSFLTKTTQKAAEENLET